MAGRAQVRVAGERTAAVAHLSVHISAAGGDSVKPRWEAAFWPPARADIENENGENENGASHQIWVI
jgi:hypothetical protein